MTRASEYPRRTGSQDIYHGRVIDIRIDDVEVAPGQSVRREVGGESGTGRVVIAVGAGS